MIPKIISIITLADNEQYRCEINDIILSINGNINAFLCPNKAHYIVRRLSAFYNLAWVDYVCEDHLPAHYKDIK